MANTATPKGKNRPESAYTFISIPALEKRVRRHLAKQSQTLIHTKQGTAARQELGEYAVYDSRLGGTVIQDTDLSTLARELGVLAETEVLDMGHMGWLWYVARQSVVTEDGKRILHHEPITATFTTPEAAHRAAAQIDGEGVAVVGYYAGEDRS